MKTIIIVMLLIGAQIGKCQEINGKWLELKKGDSYSVPNVVIWEFMNDKIKVYDFDKLLFDSHFRKSGRVLSVNGETWGKISSMNKNMLHLLVKRSTNGKDSLHYVEYAKLMPTTMMIGKEEIENVSYRFNWNNEEGIISFNKGPMDTAEEHAFYLENIDSVFFISIYRKGTREAVIPIKTATLEGLELYGLPDRPYSMFATAIK